VNGGDDDDGTRIRAVEFGCFRHGLGRPALAQDATGLDANGHLTATGLSSADGFVFRRLADGVQFRQGGLAKTILFYGPDTVRVNANLGTNYWTAPSLVVTARPQAVPFTIAETSTTLTIASAALTIEVNKATSALRFLDAQGRLYTEEQSDKPQV
jgi:alpha-D-xyloside xylohydrolase